MFTCAQMLDDYYREHVTEKVTDRRRQETAIDHLKAFLGGKTPLEVDIPLSREYKAERGMSDATIRRELGVLVAAANHAVRWRRISRNDVPVVELPDQSPPKTLWLYEDELHTFLRTAEVIDERVYFFLRIAYQTASRKRAIETLEWPQVDLVARRISLDKPGVRQTNKKRPIVPVDPETASLLGSMQSRTTSRWVLGTPADIRPRFDTVARVAGVEMLPKRGLRNAGRLSPHVLRHSRATHLLQAGKKPYAVANLLGDSLSTVLKVYGHACPDYLEEALS